MQLSNFWAHKSIEYVTTYFPYMKIKQVDVSGLVSTKAFRKMYSHELKDYSLSVHFFLCTYFIYCLDVNYSYKTNLGFSQSTLKTLDPYESLPTMHIRWSCTFCYPNLHDLVTIYFNWATSRNMT